MTAELLLLFCTFQGKKEGTLLRHIECNCTFHLCFILWDALQGHRSVITSTFYTS